MADVVPEPLFPAELKDKSVSDFLASLESLDDDFDKKIKDATAKGNVLRYVASVANGRCDVGLQQVPCDSPLGRLQGTGNMVEIYTRSTCVRPPGNNLFLLLLLFLVWVVGVRACL